MLAVLKKELKELLGDNIKKYGISELVRLDGKSGPVVETEDGFHINPSKMKKGFLYYLEGVGEVKCFYKHKGSLEVYEF